MVKACSAWNCTNRDIADNKAKGITFHRFPKDIIKRNTWALATRREGPEKGSCWDPPKFAYLCSTHFLEEDFEVCQFKRILREGVIPSVFNFPNSVKKAKAPVIQHSQDKETLPSQNEETVPIPSFNIQEHSYIIECDEITNLKRKLEAADSKCENIYKKLRNARKVISTQKKKMQKQEKKIQEQDNKIQELLNDAEEQKQLYESVQCMIPDYRARSTDLQMELITRRHGIPYSEEMKTFAKTLRECSPKAYEFLRETLNLPCSRTLRMKKENTNDNCTEFQTQTFQVLERKSQNCDTGYKHCRLMVGGRMVDGLIIENHIEE